MRSLYWGICRLFFLRYFFVSAVSQTFLSSHSLLLLGGRMVFFEMEVREGYSEAHSPTCLLALYWKVPHVPWNFFALSNKVHTALHCLVQLPCLWKDTLSCSTEHESAVFAFWRSRNGISASCATIDISTSYLFFLQRCAMSVVTFCRCYLTGQLCRLRVAYVCGQTFNLKA